MNALTEVVQPFGEIFLQVSELDRWVPWHRRLKKPLRDLAPWHFTQPHLLTCYSRRWKWDKIPHNGRHGLSTSVPTNWTPLLDAANTAQEWRGLCGVGFVTTDGIEINGWSLVGFDFDDVTPEFVPPFKTYAEKSPSKKGVRMFAWAPTEWAKRFQDTTDCHPKNCDHCEVYIGTAPRFLTVTFDVIQMEEIKQLTDKDLALIESWGMHPFEEKRIAPPSVDTAGTRLDLSKFVLTEDQHHLVNGTGELDKSKTMMGLIINWLDSGANQPDILTTIVEEPNLWAYCMSHRGDKEEKALEFAKKEINRAYGKSLTGKREGLAAYHEGFKSVTTPEPVTDHPAKPIMAAPPFPEELYDNAPGLVGEISKWIMGASHAPRKAFAYATALSVTASLIGPCCTVGGGKLNLYIALVGNTGTGKTEAIKAGLGLLSATDGKDSVHDFPASEAALRRQLGVTPNMLIHLDELAHKFESIKGGDENGMGRAILKAFDGDRMAPKVYADEKKTLPAVENPYVQILGGTTDKVWEALQTRHLTDGTLNRFIFVCLPDNPAYSRNPNPSHAVDKALKDKLNTFYRAGRMSDLTVGRHIEFTTEVKAAFDELGPGLFDKQQGEYGALYAKFEQYVGKVASILAVGDGRLVVGMADYQQALAFMTWSVQTTLHKVGGTLAGSDFERKTKKVVQLLQKAGGKMSLRDLYTGMHLPKLDMERLLETMEICETVAVLYPEKNSNKTETVWVSLLQKG